MRERSKKSRVHQPHQLIGLEIAAILEDPRHKALYIKLAKNYDGHKLIQLAKQVAEKKDIKNKGAYFMKVLQRSNREQRESVSK
ncbi:MAG: hypothetical protein A3A16_01180 [Candidatus Harrisonbacteria bacterium RIFCSPLOWO2_01_FULL_44_18]|uniref:Uncharacterized protein n=1 Tax=Candidatus Harrisonbacteria bacterium RIFCSPLOWO2_01_FULL_44_18 TaxID=1798407 RepID=A0A1G1ZMV6_9BACT|nr:MAG: hypothetical protein A3A16_01180 [Candidatus Harrisonbacteria bacterium RIFCSPLOWO2_01_FULL_44_18]